MTNFAKAVETGILKDVYTLNTGDEYDFRVGTRSLLLDALVEAGFTVPFDTFESSENVIAYLIRVVNDPLAK